MDTQAIRQAWLESKLQEQPIKVSIPELAGANLIIRELPGDEGSDLMDSCTDPNTKKVNQRLLVASMVIASVRNADDPDKALIFGPADRDYLMQKGLGPIMATSLAAIKLNGLNESAVDELKNALTPSTMTSTVVDGSLSISPTSLATTTSTV